MKITPYNINFNGFLRFKQTKPDLITLNNSDQKNTEEVVINTDNIDNIRTQKANSGIPYLSDITLNTTAQDTYVFRNVPNSDFFENLRKAHQQNTIETITLNRYHNEE